MSAVHRITLTVNGQPAARSVEARVSLGDFLRDELGLTGTHLGCEHGVCGACTVLVDGIPTRSCLMFAVQADGCAVRTVEGLAEDGKWHPLQQAFHEHLGLQCGYCTPGVLMALLPLVERGGPASEEEIRALISGNLCRCTGYEGIVESVKAVLEAGGTVHQA
ncbi:MAG: (2Fe-2S)-binding protein [Chloroflexota bacterium]|nr:(2Fe-2S)-binding protein [Chloroflexota bacterium]